MLHRRLCDGMINDLHSDEIMVSISMLVYNHERWVAKAIESVLMQRTNFRYELIIAEDCSTDRSKEIIQEYAGLYPSIIRAYYNPINLGMDLNEEENEKRVRGKYYAILEGDDYWTDPDKLQIQVDFLENNPEYSGCYHSVKVVDENDEPLSTDVGSAVFDEDSDIDRNNWPECPLPGQTGTVVMRNLLPDLSPDLVREYYNPLCNGDVHLPILMLRYGKIRRMGREMSCYRRTYTGDSWHARVKGKDLRARDYIQYLERDKLAELLWNMPYFPHYESLILLECILNDMETGKVGGQEKLMKMAVYDIGLFIAFMFVYDTRRIEKGLEPRMYKKNEFIYDVGFSECILFGTGDYGERIYNLLIRSGVNIIEVWDNNADDKKFHNIKVVKPHYHVKGIFIIIATKDYIDEMSQQLDEMGYEYKKDYLVLNDLRKRRYIETLKYRCFREERKNYENMPYGT